MIAAIDLDKRVATLEATILRLQGELTDLRRELQAERLKVLGLEQQVACLRSEAAVADSRKKDWRSTVGMFANDPEFAEIVRLGREYREEERLRELQ